MSDNNNHDDNKDVINKIVKKVINCNADFDCPWPQVEQNACKTKPFYNRPNFMADCPWPSSFEK